MTQIQLLTQELQRALATTRTAAFLAKPVPVSTHHRDQMLLLVLRAPFHADRQALFSWLVRLLRQDQLGSFANDLLASPSKEHCLLVLLQCFGVADSILRMAQQLSQADQSRPLATLLRLLLKGPVTPTLLQFYYGMVAGLLERESGVRIAGGRAKVKFDFQATRKGVAYTVVGDLLQSMGGLLGTDVSWGRAKDLCARCGVEEDCYVVGVSETGLSLCPCFPTIKGEAYDWLLNFVPFLPTAFHDYWPKSLPNVEACPAYSTVQTALPLLHPKFGLKKLIIEALKVMVSLAGVEDRAAKLLVDNRRLFEVEELRPLKVTVVQALSDSRSKAGLKSLSSLLKEGKFKLMQAQVAALLSDFARDQTALQVKERLVEVLRTGGLQPSDKTRAVSVLLKERSGRVSKVCKEVIAEWVFGDEDGLALLQMLLEQGDQETLRETALLSRRSKQRVKQLFALTGELPTTSLRPLLLFLQAVTESWDEGESFCSKFILPLIDRLAQLKQDDNLYYDSAKLIGSLVRKGGEFSRKEETRLRNQILPSLRTVFEEERELLCKGALEVYSAAAERLGLLEDVAGLVQSCLRLVVYYQKTGMCEQSFIRSLFILATVLRRCPGAVLHQRALFLHSRLDAICRSDSLSPPGTPVGEALTVLWDYSPVLCPESHQLVLALARSRKPLLLRPAILWFTECFVKMREKSYDERTAFTGQQFARSLLPQLAREVLSPLLREALQLLNQCVRLGFVSVLECGRIYWASALSSSPEVRETACAALRLFLQTNSHEVLVSMKEKLEFMAEQFKAEDAEDLVQLLCENQMAASKVGEVVALLHLGRDEKVVRLLLLLEDRSKGRLLFKQDLALLAKYQPCQRLAGLFQDVQTREPPKLKKTRRKTDGPDHTAKKTAPEQSQREEKPPAGQKVYQLRSRKRVFV